MVLVFYSTEVIDGHDGTSCFKSLYVLGEVLGVPEHDFPFGIIPAGNNPADHFH